jgi:hypothetical protein
VFIPECLHMKSNKHSNHVRVIQSGDNGGPSLDEEHVPEWGTGPIGNYFYWKRAHRAAREVPQGVMLLRVKRAERLGLTYEEYTLEILERGRHLQIEDVARIAEIHDARKARQCSQSPCRCEVCQARSRG